MKHTLHVDVDASSGVSSQRHACSSSSACVSPVSCKRWDERWHSMVEHQRQRREMDAQLKSKLDERHELEKSIECTFTPKTVYSSYSSPLQSRCLMDQMQPLIEQEHRLLLQLQSIDEADAMRAKEASMSIYNFLVKTGSNASARTVDYKRRLDALTCEYRKQRLQDIALVKNQKLDVVCQIQELERRFNIVAVGASVDLNDMAKAGFSIENCRRIKQELLQGVRGHETLKERCRISCELDQIISRAHEAVANRQEECKEPQVLQQDASRNDTRSSYAPMSPFRTYWHPGNQQQYQQQPMVWNRFMHRPYEHAWQQQHRFSTSGISMNGMDNRMLQMPVQQQQQQQRRQRQRQLGNYYTSTNAAYMPIQGHGNNGYPLHPNPAGCAINQGAMLAPRVGTSAGGSMEPRLVMSPRAGRQSQALVQGRRPRPRPLGHYDHHQMVQRTSTSPMFSNAGKSTLY